MEEDGNLWNAQLTEQCYPVSGYARDSQFYSEERIVARKILLSLAAGLRTDCREHDWKQ